MNRKKAYEASETFEKLKRKGKEDNNNRRRCFVRQEMADDVNARLKIKDCEE